jgi:hypothetical protein
VIPPAGGFVNFIFVDDLPPLGLAELPELRRWLSVSYWLSLFALM